ncbi:UDP-N-acetylmuramate dehydrogenase [Ectothiorhodospira mobilis]|uniref:UDP-N-acetylenolpyruvoylglucosamine reductase n=2 Tax=Ectothiorhodospira mobilis TaxID=195064 RepID=A0A1I4RB55_ECTMO|nr:UDP-N-acetylmuramate dehydrogenase [Ectothiorhodospira mobilis]
MMRVPDMPETNGLRGELRRDEPMVRHTLWRVGGPADRWYRPADTEDLARFLARLPADEPLFWLGLGSNLLVRDGGLRGTVLTPGRGMDQLQFLEGNRVRAGAGIGVPRLARLCADRGLCGLEFLVGIPGTLGGALAMNAGAFGDEIWSRVESVLCMDRRGGLHRYDRGAFTAGYRHVQGPREGGFVEAVLRLEPGDPEAARQRMQALLQRRNRTQPVGVPTCGSVFRNPEGDHAGRLIEAAGLKGLAIGGAQVSQRHANFIVNTGGARAADMEALMEEVRRRVRAHHGVDLQPEVCILGEPAEVCVP